MKIRATLQRPDNSTIDLTITAEGATKVGDLADAIIARDPYGGYPDSAAVKGASTIEVSSTLQQRHSLVLDPEETLEDVAIADGVHLWIVSAQRAPKTPVAYIQLYGPGHNSAYELPRGSSSIGRSVDNTIAVDDPLVSRHHARVHVGPNTIELIDLNSANGILVQGQLVQRLELQAGQDALLGSTRVTAGLLPQQPSGDSTISEIVFTRSPNVEPRYIGSEIETANPPSIPEPQPFPWVAMIVPMIAGGLMFYFMRSPMSLIFVAMSPLLMLGTWVTNFSQKRRKTKQDRARFDAQLDRMQKRLEIESARETTVRRSESLSLAEVFGAVMQENPEVWKRRPEHWSFLHVRLGLGALPTRNTVKGPQNPESSNPEDIASIEDAILRYATVPDVPIVESFEDAGAIGLCGTSEQVAWYARGLAAQISGTRGPQEFVICGIFGPAWSGEFYSMKWLPHATGSEQFFGGVPFADNAPSAAHVLGCLEDLLQARSPQGNDQPKMLKAMGLKDSAMNAGDHVGEGGSDSGDTTALPAVLVFISDDAPTDRGRLISLLERSAGRGVFPVWIANWRSRVPAACRTFVEFDEEGVKVGNVRLGLTTEHVKTEGLTLEAFHSFALKMAAYVDAGAIESSSSDVPRSVSMVSLVGEDMATDPEVVLDRWRQNGSLIGPGHPLVKTTPKLRAIVGQTASGGMHLDLRAQGPHALVGGTTGSGKSEFLQSWVLGMAAEYSPQRVTFLFVDYKGGAAFADCTNLPHSVGLVTDLSPHLVRRALVSLRAELHYRETLFTQKKAKDLLELEKRGDPQAPPALVIVIDEFAALVGEVPEFVDGVVDVAQRGRSLGIHLIMATQRPAGVIKDNLRANTNLRVALRMADDVDSDDVIGDKMAGRFDASIPGRAAAKTGPGRLSVFQSAYAGGWSFAERKDPEISLETFHLGPPEAWEKPESERAPETADKDLGPNDQQRLVATISAASQSLSLSAPRRPWLDELAEIYDLTKLSQRTDERLLLGVQDRPQHQTQVAVYFEPDADGHIAVYGTGGSGKSSALRTLAIAAGITPRGGPADVYALDFGASSLRMLSVLPHVGAVIGPDSSERVKNLFKMLREEMTRRSGDYAEVNADTITQYRQLSGNANENRILVLIDGFALFRSEYEGVTGRAEVYETFQQIMSDGRSVGIHVALSADRGQSVPASLQALIQRRVVLRMADTDGYAMLGAPRDVLDAESVPGRAIVDDLETQIAVIGGTASISDQAAMTKELAHALQRQGRVPAPPILALPELCTAEEMPDEIDGQPVLGLSAETLGAISFDPRGLFVVAGGPGSGRTNASASIAVALKRAGAVKRLLLLSSSLSPLASIIEWDAVATDGMSAMALIDDVLSTGESLEGLAVFIEGAVDFSTSMAEMSLSSLATRAKRGECFIVSDGDSNEWHTGFGLMGALKASRRGLVLAPDTHDGEMVFKTPFPRMQRREFPPGRAMYVASGKSVRVQLPLVLAE